MGEDQKKIFEILTGPSRVSDLGKVQVLEMAVAYGTAEDVQLVCNKYGYVEFVTRALCLCVHLGDVDKLKILTEYNSRIDLTDRNGRASSKYGLWTKSDFLENIVGEDPNYHEMWTAKTLLKKFNAETLVDQLREYTPKKVTPEILELLVERVPSVSMSQLIISALFNNNIPLAQKLLGRGHKIEVRDVQIFVDVDASETRRQAFKTLSDYPADQRNYVFDIVCDVLSEHSQKAVITKIVLDYAEELFDPKFFSKMYDFCDISKLGIQPLLETLVRYNQHENLVYYLERKVPKVRQLVVEGLVQYSQNQQFNARQCTEILDRYLSEHYTTHESRVERIWSDNRDSDIALGKMWTYESNEDNTITITGFNGGTADVVIPEQIAGKAVTRLGEYSLSPEKKRLKSLVRKSRGDIRSVSFPSSLREIMHGALNGCDNLKKIIFLGDDLPIGFESEIAYGYGGRVEEYCGLANSSKYTIHDGIIYSHDGSELLYCPSWKSTNIAQLLEIPEGVKRISPKAFRSCGLIYGLSLPSSIECLDPGCFSDMMWLHTIHLGNIRIVPTEMFSGISQVSKLILAEGIEEIQNGAFCDMKSLCHLSIPRSCNKIGADVLPKVRLRANAENPAVHMGYSSVLKLQVYHDSYGEQYAQQCHVNIEYLD